MASSNLSPAVDPELGLREGSPQAPSIPEPTDVAHDLPKHRERKVSRTSQASAQARLLPQPPVVTHEDPALKEQVIPPSIQVSAGQGALPDLSMEEGLGPTDPPAAAEAESTLAARPKAPGKKRLRCKKCGAAPEGSQVSQGGEENEKETKGQDKKNGEEKVSSLKHGKFSTDGRIQEFVYISSEVTDIGAKSSDIFDTILRHWNLQRPQLLIKFQSGLPHPKNLLGKDEIKKFKKGQKSAEHTPEMWKYFEHFRQYIYTRHKKEIDDFRRKTGYLQPSSDDKDDDSEDEDENKDIFDDKGDPIHKDERWTEKRVEAEALTLLNEFLYKSLSNLIDVIVRAAVRNRCWILVEGGPSGGLVLLKQAADRCTEKPKILVIDALRRKRFPYPEVEKEMKNNPPNDKVKTLEDLVKLSLSKDQADQDNFKAIKKHMVDTKKDENLKKIKEDVKKYEEQKETVGHKVSGGSKKTVKSCKSTTSSVIKEKKNWKEEDQQKVEEIKVEGALLSARLLHHAQPIDKPIRDPLKLGLDFWDKAKPEKDGWAVQTSQSLEAKKVPWNQWHFRGGTHYIFTDDDTTELLTDCLAPSGCIFIGGGDGSKKELIKMLIQGEPIVCLDNTGRLTQDFVRCHKYFCENLFKDVEKEEQEKIKEKELWKEAKKAKRKFRKERSEGTHELERKDTVDIPSMSALLPLEENTDFMRSNIARKSAFRALASDGVQGALQRNQMVSDIRGNLSQVTHFTQPELCELFLTYLRRGLQITKLCVVMDPLNPRECSGGHTEDKLSMCLSNFVILASNDTSDFADVEAVKAASDLKEQLAGAARAEGWWAVLMTYLLLVLNFLSLIVALAQNSAAPEFLTFLPQPILEWGLPAVSAASTFISGLVGRFRFMLRWSKARSASAQLDAEIWKFRTRVDDYVVVGARDVAEDEEGVNRSNELGQAFTRERKQDVTRTLFRANVTNIFNTAMEEMGTSSLHGGGFDELPQTPKRKKLPFLCWCCGMGRKSRRMPAELPPSVNEKGAQGLTQQDWKKFGHLGVDEYYQQRTLEVFERMKSQAFWLTFLQGALESAVLLLGTFGVLLSTFKETELAMICLSLAASLQALERFHALSNRLDAANAGERDLICAWQEWSAMEPMQRRFQSNVNRLVLTTEGVGVALTSAATAGVRQTLTTTKAN